MSKSKKITFMIINSLLGVTLLILFSYTQARTTSSKEYDFKMYPLNSVHLRRQDKTVKFDEIINLNEDSEVLIIASYTGQTHVGVYDPMMKEGFKYQEVFVGETRYFSMNDYLNKTKSGIVISAETITEMPRCKSKTSVLIEDVISCIQSSSRFSNNGKIYEAVNLTSLNHMGDDVYIESNDAQVRVEIEKRFIKYGYQVVKESESNSGFAQSFIRALFSYSAENIMSIGIVGLYCLFGFTVFSYYYENRKILKIHQQHGARVQDFTKEIGKLQIVCHAIGLGLSLLVFYIYKELNYFYYVSLFDVFELLIINLLMTVVISLLAISYNTHQSAKDSGVEYHVR